MILCRLSCRVLLVCPQIARWVKQNSSTMFAGTTRLKLSLSLSSLHPAQFMVIAHPSWPTQPCSPSHPLSTHLCCHKWRFHLRVRLCLRRFPMRRDNGGESERRIGYRGKGSVCIVLLREREKLAPLILRLIPRTVTPYVLWFLMLLLSLIAKHLVKEPELERGRDEPCT
jgi:hypothetical protein